MIRRESRRHVREVRTDRRCMEKQKAKQICKSKYKFCIARRGRIAPPVGLRDRWKISQGNVISILLILIFIANIPMYFWIPKIFMEYLKKKMLRKRKIDYIHCFISFSLRNCLHILNSIYLLISSTILTGFLKIRSLKQPH